jgi:dephospho-CoA kinase
VLGLAGGYCAGKSTIADWLVSQGAWRIDVDSLGHAARERCREALLARFGETALDRKALGRLVFADPAALADLEAIVHPVMDAMVQDMIAARRRQLAGGPDANRDSRAAADSGRFDHLILVDAALLFRNNFDRSCDLSIWVDAPWLLRFWRGLGRDGRGWRATAALMARQRGLGPQKSRGNADIFRVRNIWRRIAFGRVLGILERYNGKK